MKIMECLKIPVISGETFEAIIFRDSGSVKQNLLSAGKKAMHPDTFQEFHKHVKSPKEIITAAKGGIGELSENNHERVRAGQHGVFKGLPAADRTCSGGSGFPGRSPQQQDLFQNPVSG